MTRRWRGDRVDADTALREPHASAHRYVSTACHHELHGECRMVCKFCPARCLCSCHAPLEADLP